MARAYVIVGASLAGATAAITLREEDANGTITLIGTAVNLIVAGLVAEALAKGELPPMKPIRPAPKTMIGNGKSKKKMPTKAAAARPISTWFLSARLPMRTTASMTIANTAALRPKNRATMMGTLPKPA